jgi:MFS family permease
LHSSRNRATNAVVRFGADMTQRAGEGVYHIIFWRLMPVLMLCYILNYIDRSNIGLAKLAFMKDLGMTETAYGLAGGAFYLGYVSLGVPVNVALGRIGARKSLLIIMTGWGIFSAALAFSAKPIGFYLLRFLIGVSETGFLPAVLLYLSQWVPQSQRARFNGIFLAAIALGGLIGGPLGGWILSSARDTWPLKGWQFLFLIEGLPACLMGLVVFAYLVDRPGDARWLSDRQKARVESDLAAEKAPDTSVHTSLLSALRDKRFAGLVAIAMAGSIGTSSIGLWLPTIIRQTGVEDILVVGLLSAIPYIAAVAAQFFNARHSDLTGERRWHAGGPLMVAAAGWCAMPLFAHSPWASIAVMTLVTCATFSFTGPFWSMPTAMLSSAAAAGGLGFITTMLGLGSFVSPVLVGWLNEHTQSLSAGEYFYAGVLFFGAAALLAATRAGQYPTPAKL